MPIQLDEKDRGKLVAVHISGKLTSADYDYLSFFRAVKVKNQSSRRSYCA
jgi:hypothetical protein